MDLRRTVATNVREFREKLGISQEELAFRARLHRTYVSGVERGIRNPTVMVLGRLAKALNIEAALLLAPPRQAKRSASR